MAKKKKELYPGVLEAEKEKIRAAKEFELQEEPDFINGAPNYDKFEGWDPERVLVWLNID